MEPMNARRWAARDRPRSRTEEAAATIPSTWIALAHEINRLADSEKDADGLVEIKSVAVQLAELILEGS